MGVSHKLVVPLAKLVVTIVVTIMSVWFAFLFLGPFLEGIEAQRNNKRKGSVSLNPTNSTRTIIECQKYKQQY